MHYCRCRGDPIRQSRLYEAFNHKKRNCAGEGAIPLSLLFLHTSRDQVSHCCGCLLLHPVGCVGIGAEREARIVVTQHSTHGLDVHAVLEHQGSERVPNIVEADIRQSRLFQNCLEVCVGAVRREWQLRLGQVREYPYG